jgi:predicted secreted protein
MSITAGFAIYFIVWWVVLVHRLARGYSLAGRTPATSSPVQPPSAPTSFSIVRKALWTTLISAVLFRGVPVSSMRQD